MLRESQRGGSYEFNYDCFPSHGKSTRRISYIFVLTNIYNMKKSSPYQSKVVLEMKGITKRFTGVVANDHINFDLKAGEIHCILGENGAGKTTLMNILYGLYQPDEGEISIRGKKVSIKSPKDAINLGIGMIHQHSMLVDTLEVLDNIILGFEPTKGPFIDRERAEKKIIELQKSFGLDVPLKAKPWQISAVERQKVELLKALFQGAKILVMDEPTSMMCPQEKQGIIESIKQMSKKGIASIPFITHKLPEIMEVSTRVTILNRGKVVDVIETKKIRNMEDLAQKMVGRKVLFQIERKDTKKGKKVLELEKIMALDDRGLLALNGISLYIKAGEILGIAGVSGNGQNELVKVIMGIRRPTSGKVLFKGEDITKTNIKERRMRKFGYIPADRIVEGIIPTLSVTENVIVGEHWRLPFANRWIMDSHKIQKYAEKLVAEFNIDTPDVNKQAGLLSGGNMQKLLLARELSRDPYLLIASMPTNGLDVCSQEYIRQLLMREREKGKAILLVSEDLDEIMMISDRIAVIYEGRILGTFPIEEATTKKIGMLMMGHVEAQ